VAAIGAVAELVGQTIGRIPWMNWGGRISPGALKQVCSTVHALSGGSAGESPLCHHADTVMVCAVVLNVTGVAVLAVALALWINGRSGRVASAQ
jgi:hypothetical protein